MKIVQLNEIKGMTFPAGRTTRVLTGRDLLPAKNFTAGYVVIQPKGKVPLHAHSNEEIYIFVRGTGKIKVESKEEIVEAFSAIYIEPNTEHLLENIGDDEMIMIFVYSPAGIANHWSEEMTGKLK
jgi:quercetin dioxygenase-like cupin family protein